MSGRRRLVVEADGGSRGNPGVAGYGALVRDPETGRVLAERAAPIGKASNNVAEYGGMIAGLEEVLAIDAGAAVEVRMDSKLVVEQMAGRWKVKHQDMQRLCLEARALVRQITAAGGSVSWTWVPRAQNSAADALSNDGMDGKTISWRVADAPAEDVDAADGAGRTAATTLPDAVPAAGRAASSPPAMTGAARLLLVRHGTTEYTAQKRLSGRGLVDPPLDEHGLRQAEALAVELPAIVASLRGDVGDDQAVRVVCSSLQRARGTAAPVAEALGVAVEVDDAWDEQGFGVWDGLTLAQIVARWPDEWAAFADGGTDAALQRPPGGESTAELADRVLAAASRLTARPGTVVVVTSRRAALVVLGEALGLPPERFGALATDPGSASCVERWPDGGVAVPFVNRTPRLS